MENNMKDTNFITIQGWMRTKLGLVGNELLVYAIIYGFCQDGKSSFTGCAKYIADWVGITKDGTYLILKKLTSKGLILKNNKNVNGISLVDYSINYDMIVDPLPNKVDRGDEKSSVGGAENFQGGTEKSSYHNNIDNNNIDNIEREIERKPALANSAQPKFIPPTYKEMIDYAHLMDDTAGVGGFRCTRAMADEFWAYYTANGWVNSNQFRTPILDWKAKFRQWVVREKKNNKDELIEAPNITNQ